MKILLVCPAPPRSRKGNRVTAVRWARILKDLGQRVTIRQAYEPGPFALLIALHARRSADAVVQFRREHPRRPIILALTGTDLYRDLPKSHRAQAAVETADRLVALHPLASLDLPVRQRPKVRVIYQSTLPTVAAHRRPSRHFNVCVLGHLRRVKDPFRTALALRFLPDDARIRVTHAGAALRTELADQARQLEKRDRRYRWLGEIPRWRARRLLAGSDLLVLSSLMEGGANVITEAIVDGVPVLASEIPGSVGLLGENYPGYFPARDTRALARLLERAESDRSFYGELRAHCVSRAPLFEPAREEASWRRLLGELAPLLDK